MKKIFAAVFLLCLVCGGYLGYRSWHARTPQGYFESGKKYFDQQKYPEATIEFLNALQKSPGHRDSQYYLALSYLFQKDPARGGQQLKSLLEDFPDDIEANLALGRLYLGAAAVQPGSELLRHTGELAQKVLAKAPDNVDALIMSANAAAGMGDFKTAETLFKKALSVAPGNAAALLSLSAVKARQKDYNAAEDALLQAHQAHPKDTNVVAALAMYYRSRSDVAKEEQTWKKAFALNPADKTIYTELAIFYLRSNRPEEMEKVLRDAQTSNPQDPTPTITLASLYQQVGRASDGRKVLLDAKAKFPSNVELAVQIALNLMQDRPEDARKEIDQILKAAPGNPAGHVLLGEFQYKSGKFDEAEAILGKEPAVNSPFPEVHFLLGNLARRKNQMDQAQDHYRKSVAKSAAYIPARLALAEVFLAKGMMPECREEVQEALKIQPGNIPVLLLKVQLDIEEKKYSDAEAGLSFLTRADPENPAILRQMGIYQQIRGNTTAAEKHLVHALEIVPNSEQLFRDLMTLYQITRQWDRASQRFNGVTDKQAFHYEIMGSILSQSGKTKEAEIAYKNALQKNPQRLNSELLLTQLYVQTGRVDEAAGLADDLAKKVPGSAEVLALKGHILQVQGKNREAETFYRKALDADPNSDLAANNLACLLADEGRDLELALQYAQLLKKRKPDDANTADTLGWVHYKLGQLMPARTQAEFAISKDPNNGTFQYHLGMIYKSTSETARAEAALRKAVASSDLKDKNLAESALKTLSR